MSVTGQRTRNAILDVGLEQWPNVNARAIARRLGLTHSGVLYHFGDAAQMRDAIAAYAVQREDARVIRYLIFERHASIVAWSPAKRQAFLLASIP